MPLAQGLMKPCWLQLLQWVPWQTREGQQMLCRQKQQMCGEMSPLRSCLVCRCVELRAGRSLDGLGASAGMAVA